MKRIHIAIDIPEADAHGLNDDQIRRYVTKVLVNESEHGSTAPLFKRLIDRLGDAASTASINRYDDKYGGPVFYIP